MARDSNTDAATTRRVFLSMRMLALGLILALVAVACGESGSVDDATSAAGADAEDDASGDAVDTTDDDDTALEEPDTESGAADDGDSFEADDADEAMDDEEAVDDEEDATDDGDADEDTAEEDPAAGDLGGLDPDDEALAELDTAELIERIAAGFGSISGNQQRAIRGIVDEGEPCDRRAGPRARPSVSQIEVEIITIVDNCLQFDYGVANFRTVVEDLQELREQDDVVAVSPLLLDYRLNQLGPLDPTETQWPIETVAGVPLLDAADAPMGQGVTIAIIDSGIDLDRLDVENVNIRRVPESGSGDYIESGHGTVAAAAIVAPMGSLTRGIAPQAELLDVPADLCHAPSCSCGPCAQMTPAEAIRWSTDNDADIISMSFGYQPAPKPSWWQRLLDDNEAQSVTETLEVAIAYAGAHGIAMTAAAGNCGDGESKRCETADQFEIPAGHAAVIGVGALEPDDDQIVVADYTTRQPYVELAAPGTITLIGADDELIAKRGTSYAAPFVTAAFALLLGDDGPLAGRDDGASIARDLISSTAIDIEPEGRDFAAGFGQIQLSAAIEAARVWAEENPIPTPEPESADAEANLADE